MTWLTRLLGWGTARREADVPAAPPPPPPAPPAAAARPAPPVPVHAVGDHPGGTLGLLAEALANEVAPPPLWRSGVPPEVIELSHVLEGFRATPYLCEGGVWTIGYGSTRDPVGKPVTPATPPVTREQAARMAERDLARAAGLAAAAFPDGLPPRWGAVAILASNNLGDMRVWGATLHRMLTAEQWRAAAEQLRHYRNTDGRPSLGLRRRRWCEAAYALGWPAERAYAEAWRLIESADDWPPLPR